MPNSVLATSGVQPTVTLPGTAPAGAVDPTPMQPSNVIGLDPNAARQPQTNTGLTAPQTTSATTTAAVIPFLSSVGSGAANRTNDVKAVQQRLADLGFNIVVDGRAGPQTNGIIALFASIVENETRHSQASSKLTPNSALTKRLFAANAPTWTRMPSSGPGFTNIDSDGYNWGTARTAAVIKEAGRLYQANHRDAKPNTSLIQINDVSRKDGSVKVVRGKAEHSTHRNGVDIDIRLPRKNGDLGGTKTSWASYDRDAAYAIVDAFASQGHVERILLADREIKARAVREGKSWAHKYVVDAAHYNHFHVDVKAG